MKRLLLILLAVIMSASAFSQIQISQKASKFDVLCSVRSKYVYIARFVKGDYTNYSLVLPTSNQFDDPFRINLGEDAETAMETLKSMAVLYDLDGNESVTIKDSMGKESIVRVNRAFGLVGITFDQKGYAGTAGLNKGEYDKLVKKFEAALNK